MEQGSDLYFEEGAIVGALTNSEHARMIEYLRAIGVTEKQINDMWLYVASVADLPEKESDDQAK